MAGLHFDITGDNKNLLRNLEGSKQGIRSLTREAEKESMNLDDIMKRIGQSAAAIGVGFSATQLIRDVARVRGEFQQLEVALNTMSGSEEKANELFQQLVNTAAKTPFDLKGVAGGAKQLLAYGVAAEEVNDTIIRLGDIAAGLSIPLGDLVYLYGTTMTQGRLFTQDLRQFMGRGIPLADELAKQFGVAKDKVGGLVTEGKVGFPEVEKAIRAMTSEGGKFAGLMENQSKTITGQISNLQDAVDSMFNEIGKSSQGAISGAISTASSLVENYERVLDILGQIVVTYGAYKAAMVAASAFNKAATTVGYSIELEQLQKLIPAKKASANADVEAAQASGKLSKEMAEKVVLAREEAQAYKDALDKKRKLAAHEAAEAMTKKRVNEENIKQLKDEMGQLFENGKTKEANAKAMQIQALETEGLRLAEEAETAVALANTATTEFNTFTHELNTVAMNKETLATKLLTKAKAGLNAIANKMYSALTNPYILGAAAVAALAFGIYKLITAKSAEEKAVERVNKQMEKEKQLIEERKNRINDLINTVQDETKTDTDRYKAYELLKKEIPALTEAYTFQELKTKELSGVQKELNQLFEKESIDNAKKNVEEYTKEIERLKWEQKMTNNQTMYKMYSQQIADVNEKLKRAKDYIKEYDEAQEALRPIDVRIKEAEDIEKQAQDAFDKAKAAMDAERKKLEETFGERWKSFEFLIPIDIRMNYDNTERQLKEAENKVEALETQQKNTNKQGETKDKAYWEQKKKEAQSNLEALDLAKKGSAEWNKYVAEIRQAEKKIAQYDVSSKTDNKTKEAAKKYQKMLQEHGEETKRIAKDMELDVEQSRVDAMEEGYNKTQAQMKLNHKRELEELEREKADYLKAKKDSARALFEADPKNQGKTFDDSQIKLTKDEEELFATKERNVTERQYREETETNKDALREMLGDYMTYAQARKAKEEEFKKKKDEINEQILAGNAEVSQSNIDILNKEEKDALAAIDNQFASKSQVYLGWVGQIADMTIIQLSRALGEAQAKLDTLEDDTEASPEELAIARAKVAQLQERIKQLEGKSEADTRSIDTWKELGDVLGETASQFEELGDSIGGTAGQIVSSLGSTFSSTVSLMSNIVQFVDICDKGIMNTAGTAVSAIKLVEASTVILTIISTAVQVIQKIANLARQMHDKKYEKEIEKNQEEIDKLGKSYDALAEKVEEVYGSERVQSLQEMNEKLEQQNKLIQEQKDAENEKKKPDESATKAYDDAMAENKKKIEENTKAMQDAIFGEDIKSAIENFGDAYAEALEGNMSMNVTAKEQAVRMMKQMVKESINEYIQGSKKMEDIREKMDALYADGVFSEADQKLIINELEQFNRELDERFGWAEDLFSEEESSSSSSKRGIATASQESVDENNGRLMSIQLSMGEIKEQMIYTVTYLANMSSSVVAGNSILSDIREQAVRANGHLEDIVKYTKPLNDRINDVVNAVNRINSK